MLRRTYYEILGLKHDATSEQVRSSYRKLARKYHPDQNPDDDAAEEAFKAVAEAYRVLSDPDARHAYDTLGVVPAGAAFADLQLPPKRRVVDLVRDLGRSATRAVRRGNDVKLDVTLSFVDAMRGTHRVLELPRRAENGRIEARRLRFDLPPGLDDGKVLRWPGEGEPEPRGGRTGDLYISIAVSPHPLLRREGSDVRCVLPLTLPEVLRGTALSVPTLFGPELLKVPVRTWSGDTLRLRGRGVPTTAPGDAVFEVEIMPPTKVPRALELAEALYADTARPDAFADCLKESAGWRRD